LLEKEAREIFIQIAKALKFCHGEHCIHRDLKFENVLLAKKDSLLIKVSAFSLFGSIRTNYEDY